MYYINDFCFLIENDIINDIDRFLFFCFWLYMQMSYYIMIMNLCNLRVLLCNVIEIFRI